jgi:NADPH:quinone reductase
MRALLCKKTGENPVLAIEQVDDPAPATGQVLVKVQAAAVNFVDTLVISGKYQIPFEPPFIPGSDIAGVVVAVGPRATRFSVGDRVHGITMLGAFAELVAVPEAQLRPTPDALDAGLASTLGSGTRTAYDALVSVGRLQAGQDLVILGASGAVGSSAIAIGKALGARVIACASAAKHDLCVAAGADEVVDYTGADFKGNLKRLCPRGADVVLDMVGGDYTEPALRATGFGGRFVVVGFAAGQVPRAPLNLVLLKGSSIHGYEIVDFERHRPQEAEANRAALERMLSDGQVKPAITATYPLDRAPEAVRNVSGRNKQGVSILTFA